MDRKIFLKSFLGALGAVDIIWGNEFIDKIYGTVIYDLNDPEERQDFVWHMSEENIPSEDLKKLLDYLSLLNYIDIDKIFTPIEDIPIDFIEPSKLENVWNELFDIGVRMIDDNIESDMYFIHT